MGVILLLLFTSILSFALELKDAFPYLRFKNPVLLLEDPIRKGVFYVVEQRGAVKVFSVNSKRSQLFIDIRDRVKSGGEMGLLGMAFHPEFEKNGRIFLSYTNKDMYSVISELGPDKKEKIILKVKQPYSNHNGGHIVFGPDGYLYIGFGDGGSAGDPLNHAQNPQTLLGAILRIDVGKEGSYRIPPDNPFGEGEGRREIYAYGFRNPWRWSFDRKTGELWVGDVGQDRWEEINVVEKGKNYGWRCYEGFAPYKLEGCKEKDFYTFPIYSYPLKEGNCSIIGGYVYRGKLIKDLYGWYIFGDYCSGRIWALKRKPGNIEVKLLFDTEFKISSFAEDRDGEIYVIDYKSGKIYKLLP